MKSSALQAVAASAVLCGGVSGAAEIRYALDKPAFVTIAVEDASGRRVRNLVSAQRREAGECGETWDGFDDAGTPCAAGVYHWRGRRYGSPRSPAATASPGLTRKALLTEGFCMGRTLAGRDSDDKKFRRFFLLHKILCFS